MIQIYVYVYVCVWCVLYISLLRSSCQDGIKHAGILLGEKMEETVMQVWPRKRVSEQGWAKVSSAAP